MKSPLFVTPLINEHNGKTTWILQRDDGRPIYMDNGLLPVTAVEYINEDSAIKALQKYSHEYYEDMQLELVHRQTEDDRIASLFLK